jgi:integrase
MPRAKLPQHVHVTRRRGKEYSAYHPFRGTKKAGKRIALPGMPYKPDGTPDEAWWAAYRAAAGKPVAAPRGNSFAALIEAREKSPEWAQMTEGTRVEWGRHHKTINAAWGDRDVKALEPMHIMALRDAFADVPPADPRLRTKPIEDYKDRTGAANNLLRALSGLLSWSIPRGWRADNPCSHVPQFKPGDGYPPWPMRAIDHHKKHAPVHLWWVAAHALYTGQRQSDVIGMRKADVRGDEIRVIQEKTRKPLWIPLHRDLRAIQDEMRETIKEWGKKWKTPRLSKHLLVNSHGAEWTQDGFRASWQAEMDRRIFGPFRTHRLVFHGLRKSAVVMLLEAGCTTPEVAAITGQTWEMVEHYARMVNQRKLARAAILKWEHAGAQSANK